MSIPNDDNAADKRFWAAESQMQTKMFDWDEVIVNILRVYAVNASRAAQ